MKLPLAGVAALLLAGCAAPRPESLPACGYAGLTAPEYVFVLPTFAEYNTGSGTTFYTRPRRDARLDPTSWTYQRDYLGQSYRFLDLVSGADGDYRRWLLQDCRVLYTPLPRDKIK